MKVSAYSGSDFVNGKVNEDTFILSLAAEKTSKDELEFVGSLLGNEIKERLLLRTKIEHYFHTNAKRKRNIVALLNMGELPPQRRDELEHTITNYRTRLNELVVLIEQYHSKYSSIYLSQYQQILQELHEENPEDIKDDPAKERPNPQTPTSHIDESQELMSEANPGAKSKIGKIEVTDLQFDF